MRATFEGWAVLELLGHRVRYGRVSEVTLFGEAMCRIEIPSDPPAVEFYSGKALYGIRPAAEASIRAYHAPRRALAAGDDDEIDADSGGQHDDSDDGEPEPISEQLCPGCSEPIADDAGGDFEAIPVDGQLWHRSCVDEARPAEAPDPAVPEPIEGGA